VVTTAKPNASFLIFDQFLFMSLKINGVRMKRRKINEEKGWKIFLSFEIKHICSW